MACMTVLWFEEYLSGRYQKLDLCLSKLTVWLNKDIKIVMFNYLASWKITKFCILKRDNPTL